MNFSFQDKINLVNPDYQSAGINIIRKDNIIYFNNLKLTQSKDGNFTYLYNTLADVSRGQQAKGISSINISRTYGQARLNPAQETEKINQFYRRLAIYFYGGIIPISGQSFNELSAAYVYGDYTIPEIADTVLNGSRAVHPAIPARLWRSSSNYKKYLHKG